MSTRGMALILFMSIAASAADKDRRFRVNPAASYSTKQTAEGVTIAAVPYADAEQAKTAFGKVSPYEHGVLPVLLIIHNGTGKALNLQGMEATYTVGNRRVEQTPAADVPYLEGPRRPNLGGSPIPPIPIPRGKKQSKLLTPEITSLAFAAKMLPAGDQAHGFVYFQTAHSQNASLYVRGLIEASTGRELLYFEVPLN